jgi:rsbT co-antagonist protein RsbR
MRKLQNRGCRGWNAHASLMDYHSAIRVDGKELTLAQIINKKKKDILVSWRDMMLTYGGRTFELMTLVQFEEQAKVFLNEFVNAITSQKYGDITVLDFEGLLGFLRKISREGAEQGFSPSYIANFIFSLKYILTDIMQNYFKDLKELNNEITAVHKLLDALGVYTFETYAKTRDGLIAQQLRAINLLQEARVSRTLLKVDEGIVALPIMGIPDDEGNIKITESLLEYIAKYNCRVVILDLTNISSFDLTITKHLMSTIDAIKLMDAEVIITGINPDITKTLPQTEVKVEAVPVFNTLKEGILHASAIQEIYMK